MAKQNRTILKTYFQQGDIPTQGQYTDLIDSNLNLNDGNTQTLSGSISASSFISSAGITLAGDVSSSGNLIIGSITASSGASIAGKLTAASAIITNITGSNISASLQIITDKIVTGSASNGFTLVGDITSSGVISASGGFIGNATSATSASIITGLTTTVTELNYLGGLTSGEATQIKNIGSAAISAAEWSYVATGQNHGSNSQPTFETVNITKTTHSSTISIGETFSVDNKGILLSNVVVSTIERNGSSDGVYSISSTELIAPEQVISCTTPTTKLQVGIGTIEGSTFQFYFFNPTAEEITSHTARVNCVVF